MKEIISIACISQDRGLGYNNQLLWRSAEDMDFFRTTTSNHTVVMGRKTYESIGKPLPHRRNIVLSRQDIPGVETYHSPDELKQALAEINDEVFIIGGASLYELFLPLANRLLLTEVAATKPADTFFPEFNRHDYYRKVLKTFMLDDTRAEIVEYTKK